MVLLESHTIPSQWRHWDGTSWELGAFTANPSLAQVESTSSTASMQAVWDGAWTSQLSRYTSMSTPRDASIDATTFASFVKTRGATFNPKGMTQNWRH